MTFREKLQKNAGRIMLTGLVSLGLNSCENAKPQHNYFADLNGDGRIDNTYIDFPGSDVVPKGLYLYTSLNSESGFEPPQRVLFMRSISGNRVLSQDFGWIGIPNFTDFDGDSVTDVTWKMLRNNVSEWYWAKGNGDGSFQERIHIPRGPR